MFEMVIGLEVHIQLNTQTKLFCSCKTSFGSEPNTNTCPVCLGMPGSLPVFNKTAAIKAMKFANAINAKINDNSIFERKNYFYPDLPAGYQISQLQVPIVEGGEVIIKTAEGQDKTIKLNRAHLETDAGKNVHGSTHSYVDLNRAGTPLLEIVSEPDFRSADEVTSYLKQLHSIVRYLDISDANMQEGSFRCDVNISIRPKGEDKLYTRAEIKNLNSFKFIEKAIAYEFARHVEAWEDGDYDKVIVQETRLFDTDTFETKSMRGKEEAMDYRYFPDPDLKPIKLLEEMYEAAKDIPEMPREKQLRYTLSLGLKEEDAIRIVQDKDLSVVFEELVSEKTTSEEIKTVITLLVVELGGYMNAQSLSTIYHAPITINQIRDLIKNVNDNIISIGAAKKVLAYVLELEDHEINLASSLMDAIEDPVSIDRVIDKLKLKQMSNEVEILEYVKKVISEDPKSVQEYKGGKTKIIGSFVGKVMKATGGQANPQVVNKLLKQELEG